MVEILDVPHVMITHVMITPRDSNAPRPCVFVEEVVIMNSVLTFLVSAVETN